MTTADPPREKAPPSDSTPMFGNFTASKNQKAPKWAAPLLTAAVAAHVLVFGFMWIKSIWEIEQLDAPKSSIDLVSPPPLPSGGSPPKGSQKQQVTKVVPKKIKVKDLTQPVKVEKQPEQVATNDAPGNNDGSGDDPTATGPGGPGPGGPGVDTGPPTPPPPPPPPAPPENIAPNLLEGQRIGGDPQIKPDDVTVTEINRSGKTKLVSTFKLCISVDGNVSSVKMLKSSTFPAYDQKIQTEMHAWRYRPYAVNGTPTPVCTAVTFIYSLSSH